MFMSLSLYEIIPSQPNFFGCRLCCSMYGEVALKLMNTRTQDEDKIQMIQRQILDKLSFSDEATTADKKIDQPHANKAEDDQERQEEKSAKTQEDEKKKKRRKKPKKLTPEEIAVKAAEGMKRRAKKKPPPKKVLRPQA